LLVETIRFTDAYRAQMVLVDVQQLFDARAHK
jgi:hypothetical protein